MTNNKTQISKVEGKQKNTMSDKHKPSEIDAYITEHQELVQLFIHEDLLAWRLNSGFLAMNSTLFTAAVYIIGTSGTLTTRLLVVIIVLFLIACFLNVYVSFTFQSSHIHRISRLFRAYQLEDKLKELGIEIQTFSSCERKIHNNHEVLEVSEEEVKYRPLKWYEKIKVLSLGFYAPIIAILLWISILVWVILKVTSTSVWVILK